MPQLTQPGRTEMPQWQADAQPSNEHRIGPHLCATDRYPDVLLILPIKNFKYIHRVVTEEIRQSHGCHSE